MNGAKVARIAASLIAIAGLAAALTLMYDGMRAVLAIGGFCASGNTAFVIQTQCPDSSWVLFPAIFGGLILAGVYAACAPTAAKSVVLLAWPALFISLGWNFIQFGFGWAGGGGLEAGFLIPGILFWIMGAAPLVFWVPQLISAALGKTTPGPSPVSATSPHIQLASTNWYLPAPTASSFAGAGGVAGGGDVSGELERLAGLHNRGDLSDAEFDAAKHRVLGSGS